MPNKMRKEFNWKLIDSKSYPKDKTERALSAVLNKAEKEERRKGVFTVFLRWATGVAAAILICFISYLMLDSKKTPPVNLVAEQIVVSAPNGQTRTVYLPDSTKVVLNSGSVIFYPETFNGSKRSVCLSGEALFDVTSDKDYPFFVKTSDVTVRVLGTKFNVRAYPDEAEISTVLCRGSVEVSTNSEICQTLVPGQEFRYRKTTGDYSVDEVDTDSVVLWESGGIYLEDGSIHDLVRLLQLRFDVNIYLTTDRYDKDVLTVKFSHGEGLDDILSVVSRLLPGMKYKMNDSNVFIK